jgi:hypothetical protein
MVSKGGEVHSDRGGEFALRRLNFSEDEQQLRAEVRVQLDAVGGRSYQAPPYEEAGDSTNTVRVAVNRAGTVVDVHFRSDWQTELTSSALGAALLEAHRNAGSAMMNALALAALAKEERAKAEGDAGPTEPARLPEVPTLDIWQVWQRLSDVEDLMYRAGKLTREEPGHEIRTLHSRFGLLTATCEGRAITSISVDPRLAQQSSTEQLRAAAMELFQEAGQRIGRDHL